MRLMINKILFARLDVPYFEGAAHLNQESKEIRMSIAIRRINWTSAQTACR